MTPTLVTQVAEPMRRPAPFVGLAPFVEEDAALFYGREEETLIVSGNLRAARLTILYGPSGVGKTSLLRAGVVPNLRARASADADPGRSPLAICVFQQWQDDPLPGLAEAIRLAAVEALGGRERELWPAPPLADALHAWTDRVRTLLILDQFEEYFLYHPEEDGRFETEFAQIVNDPQLRVNVLVSIREEAWAKLDRFEGRIPRLFANYIRLQHLHQGAARSTIELPVETWRLLTGQPHTVDPELVEAVVEAAGAGRLSLVGGDGERTEPTDGWAVEAAFVQLVMERLWREAVQAGSTHLTLAALSALGGPQRIVSNHLSQGLATLARAEQTLAADAFSFLVTPRSRTRLARTAAELAASTERQEHELRTVLEKLCLAEAGPILRPIVAPTGTSAGTRYELIHDILAEPILEWHRRRGWEQTTGRRRRWFGRAS